MRTLCHTGRRKIMRDAHECGCGGGKCGVGGSEWGLRMGNRKGWALIGFCTPHSALAAPHLSLELLPSTARGALFMTNRSHTIVVIPGDSIGPEIVESGLRIIEATRERVGGFDLNIDQHHAG